MTEKPPERLQRAVISIEYGQMEVVQLYEGD